MNPLLALAVLQVAQQARPVSAEESAARLVPAEATILIRFESVAALLDLVHAFGPIGGEPVASLGPEMLLGAMQLPFAPSAVDGGRPIYLALTLDPEMPVPVLTQVVPVADARPFSEVASRTGGKVVQAGGYAGISSSPSYAASAVPSPLVLGLRPGVVSAHLDLATLTRLYRPMIDAGLAQFETALEQSPEAAQMPIDLQPLMTMYAGAGRAVVDSAETLDLALERRGDELALALDLRVHEGSAMDGWGSDERVDLASLAGRVDATSSFQMTLSANWSELCERFGGLWSTVLAVYPAPLRADIEKALEAQESLSALLLPGMAACGDFGPGGMRFAYVMRCSKPEEFVSGIEALAARFDGQGGCLRLHDPEPLEVEGLAAKSWRVEIDFETIARATAEDVDLASRLPAMLESIYGKDLRLALAREGQLVAIALSSDEGFLRASMARLCQAPGSPPAGLARALQRTGGSVPSLTYRFDFGRLLGQMGSTFTALDGQSSVAYPEKPLAITVWGAIQGRTWSGGTDLNLRELLDYVQATTQAAAEQPRKQ